MTIRPGVAAAIFIAFLGAAASARQGGPVGQVLKISLEAHLEEATGAGALDCGRHGHSANDEDAMKKSLKCGLDAAMNRKPFRTIRDVRGIDSQVAHGLLSKADGKILRFTFDSAPCGNPACPSRFETQACRSPAVSASGRDPFSFVCN